MKLIKLSKGQFTKVSDSDFENLSKFKWSAEYMPKRNKYYAIGHTPAYKNSIRMHTVIMSPPKGKCVDHINGDTLDNTRENLRICTQRQNTFNRVISNRNTTGYKGVCKRKRDNGFVYQASIGCNGKFQHIGMFNTAAEASEAYEKKAKEIYGEFFCKQR